MNWDTIQQFIRILLYTLGGLLFGDGFADTEIYQQFIGGVLAVGSFVWWYFWERNRPEAPPRL